MDNDDKKMFDKQKDQDKKMTPPEVDEDDNMEEGLNEEEPAQDNEETSNDNNNDITPEPRERLHACRIGSDNYTEVVNTVNALRKDNRKRTFDETVTRHPNPNFVPANFRLPFTKKPTKPNRPIAVAKRNGSSNAVAVGGGCHPSASDDPLSAFSPYHGIRGPAHSVDPMGMNLANGYARRANDDDRMAGTVSEGEKEEEKMNEDEDESVPNPEEDEEDDGNDSDTTIVPENEMEE